MAKRITTQDLAQASIVPQATIRDTYIQQGVKKSQTLYDLAMLQDVLPIIAKQQDMKAELEAEQKINEALASDGINGLKELNKNYKGSIPGVYTPLAKARTSQALARRAVDLEKNAVSQLTDKYTNAAAAGVDLEVPYEQAVKEAREKIRKDLHPDWVEIEGDTNSLEGFYFTTEYNKHSSKLQGKVEDTGFQIEALKRESKAKLHLYQDVGNIIVGGGTSEEGVSRVEQLTQTATEAYEAGVPNVSVEMFSEVKSQLIRMANSGASQEALALLIELGGVKIGPVGFAEGDNRDAYNSLFSKLATAAGTSDGDDYLASQRRQKQEVDNAYSMEWLDEESQTPNPVFELTKASTAREANKLIEQIAELDQAQLASIGVSWDARNELITSAREYRSSISAMGAENQKNRTFAIKDRIQSGDIEGARQMLQTAEDRITFREEVDSKSKIDRESDRNKDASYVVDIAQEGVSDSDRVLYGDKASSYEEQDRNWAEIQRLRIREISETEDPVLQSQLRENLQKEVFEQKQRVEKRREDFLERRRQNDETISERVMAGVPITQAIEGLNLTAQEKSNTLGKFSGLANAKKNAEAAFTEDKLTKEIDGILDDSIQIVAGVAMDSTSVNRGYFDRAGTITETGLKVKQAYVENIKNTMRNWADANTDLLISDPEAYTEAFNNELNGAKIQYNPLYSEAPTSVVPRVKPSKREESQTPLTENEKQFNLYENSKSNLSSLEDYSKYKFEGTFSDDLVNSMNIESSSRESIRSMSSSSYWNNDLMREYVRQAAVNNSKHTSFWSEDATGTLIEDSGLIPQQLIDLAVIQARDASDSPEGTEKLELIKMLSIFNRAYSNEEIRDGFESGKYPLELAQKMFWETNQEYVPVELLFANEGNVYLYDEEKDAFYGAQVVPELNIEENFDYRRTRTFTNVDDLYEFVYNSGQFEAISQLLGVDGNTFFKAQKNLLNQ